MCTVQLLPYIGYVVPTVTGLNREVPLISMNASLCDHRSPGTPILDSKIGVSKFYDSQLSTKLLLIDGSHIASLVFSPRHSGSKYPIFGQYGMSSTPRNCTGIDIQSPAVYACPPE